jgi:hypothetical protein
VFSAKRDLLRICLKRSKDYQFLGEQGAMSASSNLCTMSAADKRILHDTAKICSDF